MSALCVFAVDVDLVFAVAAAGEEGQGEQEEGECRGFGGGDGVIEGAELEAAVGVGFDREEEAGSDVLGGECGGRGVDEGGEGAVEESEGVTGLRGEAVEEREEVGSAVYGDVAGGEELIVLAGGKVGSLDLEFSGGLFVVAVDGKGAGRVPGSEGSAGVGEFSLEGAFSVDESGGVEGCVMGDDHGAEADVEGGGIGVALGDTDDE